MVSIRMRCDGGNLGGRDSRVCHSNSAVERKQRAPSLDLVPDWRGDFAGLALELGFSHHAHFTAAFRAAFGFSPAAWARRIGRARIR